MKPVRTSVDIPRELHRRIKQTAARRGCSARQLILESIQHELAAERPRPQRRLDLSVPIVPSLGKQFDLSNEQIYDLIEFP